MCFVRKNDCDDKEETIKDHVNQHNWWHELQSISHVILVKKGINCVHISELTAKEMLVIIDYHCLIAVMKICAMLKICLKFTC